MKSLELPDDIAVLLEPIVPEKRGAFLREHGLKIPHKTQQNIFSKHPGQTAQLFTDGASRGNPGEAGAGFLLLDQNKTELFRGKKYLGHMTNNSAEWNALILGLEKARELRIKALSCFLDSELVVKQVRGEYKVKHPELKPLQREVLSLLAHFESITFIHVRREQNLEADQLANEAIDESL